jgi:hypothetical protein
MTTRKHQSVEDERAAVRNEDPISGQPGAHPVGAGLGAATAGAAAGMVGGAIAGPIGAAIGAVAGGIAGGYAGKAVAEEANPTFDSAYWRDYYQDSPYYNEDIPYENFEAAYRMGWEACDVCNSGTKWEEHEAKMRQDWESNSPSTHLSWNEARRAARESYDLAHKTACDRNREKDNFDSDSTCKPTQPR